MKSRWVQIESIVVPILIKEFTSIYEDSIEKGQGRSVEFRHLRFNLARILLELYTEIGELPYTRYPR